MISRTRAARLIWLSHFDMEHVIGAVLRNGMVLCVGLALVGFLVQEMRGSGVLLAHTLQARSVPRLLLTDFQHRTSPDFWLDLLIDTTVATLMLIPYIRILVSACYLGFVEHHRNLALLTGLVLIIVTIVVLTDFV